MADKEHADVFLLLETYQQLDHDSCTETSSAEVASITHQDLRFQGKCTCNTDTLSLTTTHVMRIAVYKISGKFYHFLRSSLALASFSLLQFPVIDQRPQKNIHDLSFSGQKMPVDPGIPSAYSDGSARFLLGKIEIFSMIKDLATGRLVKRDDHGRQRWIYHSHSLLRFPESFLYKHSSSSLQAVNVLPPEAGNCLICCTEHDIGFLKHNGLSLHFPHLAASSFFV